jgi:hypothetical protein
MKLKMIINIFRIFGPTTSNRTISRTLRSVFPVESKYGSNNGNYDENDWFSTSQIEDKTRKNFILFYWDTMTLTELALPN